jgi:transcriptional regulator with GAF, ATPase, and Fis domain
MTTVNLTDATTATANLDDSLAGLARLAMGDGQQGLEELLLHIAEFAVQAIPGADGAGLTMLEDERADTIVATTDFVREVDTIQYTLGEGPCITAAAQRRTMHSGTLGHDDTWPTFSQQIAHLDVHSVLSLPLLAGPDVFGTMNVYARAEHAFADRAIEFGEHFAIPAAISVYNARALSQAQRLAAQLQAALTSRSVIDQSLGIVMSRSGCTADEAFDRLRVMSQSEHMKLALIAQHILDEAVRRARARRTHEE